MFEKLKQELEPVKFITDKKIILPKINSLLKASVEKYDNYALSFSGGLDSTLLALLSKKKNLYSVGSETSEDIVYVRKISEHFKWPVKFKIITKEDANETINKVLTILQDNKVEINVINVGVGCVLYSILNMVKEDGFDTLMTGLGSEEIFAGYERHTKYKENFDPDFIQEKLWEGLKDMETRDLARDLAIANHFKIKLIAPFLDEDLVRFSIQIHPDLKVNKTRKKIILSESAIKLGIPEEFALRKKKAAQYGSNFDRFLLRVANTNNFKSKREYIKSLIK